MPTTPLPDHAVPNVPVSKTGAAQKCVTVIFNPVSGQSDPDERKREITEALAEHGYQCQHLVTTKEKGAREFAKEALADGADLLAVSGGDGTVVEAMSALVGTDVPLAIFPAGTGNLLSLNLNLPKTVPDAVHAALFGTKRPLDLAKIVLGSDTKDGKTPNDAQYFAILAGAGYDALIIKDADRDAKKRMGAGAYLVAALKNLKRRPVKATITLDGKPLRRVRAKSVMVANMGKMQGNVEFIPDAAPDDGFLDVAVLKAETMGQWTRLMWSVATRRLRDDPAMEYHRAKKVTVELSRAQAMQFDGEEESPQTSFTVEVVPNAVQVMIPQDAPV